MAEEDSLTLEDICGYPFFMREPGSASREITDGLLKAHQQKADIQWESVSNQSLIRAVEVNPGITVLSGKLIEEEVDAERCDAAVHPEAFIRNFTLIYHKKKFMTQALEALVALF